MGSPIVTIGAPFLTKDPALIWGANLALLTSVYAFAYAFGRTDGGEQLGQSLGGVSSALSAIDFGTGQERGIRGEARERFFEKQKSEKEAQAAAEKGEEEAAATK